MFYLYIIILSRHNKTFLKLITCMWSHKMRYWVKNYDAAVEHKRPKSACWILMWHCYWPQLPAAAPNAHFHNLLFWIRGESDHCSRIWSLNLTNMLYKFCRKCTSIIHYMESVRRQSKACALDQYSGTLSWSMRSPRNDSLLDCFVCTQRALNAALDALVRRDLCHRL